MLAIQRPARRDAQPLLAKVRRRFASTVAASACALLAQSLFGLTACGNQASEDDRTDSPQVEPGGDAPEGDPSESIASSDSDGDADGAAAQSPQGVDAGTVETAGSGADRADAAPAATRCTPAPGTTGNPSTMVEVVELINGLPMPVTLPCFLQSLTRPLKLYATSSVISAQPANGFDNPRLFIIGEGLSLSVVPDGDSRHLLEIGEFTAIDRSIKGELEFPVNEALPLEAPLKRIHNDEGSATVCRICHYPEVALPQYPVLGAFESIAYRPFPDLEVNFDYVAYQYSICDAAAQPERCEFLAALFDQGQVSRGEFPKDMPTFD